MNINDLHYENKFVAFIDILGFKNTIEQIDNDDNDLFNLVCNILCYLKDESIDLDGEHSLPVYTEQDGRLIETELGNPVITAISDCVVISTDDTFDGFKSICNLVTKLFTRLYLDGIFMRGAITHGKICHTNEILFGTAYQLAYQKEETEAIYPRVIIDKSVMSRLNTEYRQGVSPFTEFLIGEDVNELMYLRPFPFLYFPYKTASWSNFLIIALGEIIYKLNMYDERVSGYSAKHKELSTLFGWNQEYGYNICFTGGNEKVADKYIWLSNEFNKTLIDHNDLIMEDNNNKPIPKIVFSCNIWSIEY